MVMTLRADVDVRIVFVRERVRCGQKEIVRRGQRLAKVVRVSMAGYRMAPDVPLMRVMTGGASNSNCAGFVRGGQRAIFDQRFASGPGVATTATRDPVRAFGEIFFQLIPHGAMCRGIPIFEIRTV